MRSTPLTRRTPLTAKKALKAALAPGAAPKRARKRQGELTAAQRADRAHLAWIRTLPCVVGRRAVHVPAARCALVMHAHHVRLGTGGGMGLKPADRWAIPVCCAHHLEIHNHGQRTFEARYGLDTRAIAAGLAARSPHLTTDLIP